MKIGLDMLGGDYAPLEAVKGVLRYLEAGGRADRLVLLGDEAVINGLLREHGIPADGLTIVHAPEAIDMHEHPTKALKEKRSSSIAIGFGLLATGKIDAIISAGNTGAMLVGAMFSIKPLPGVLRPTIGAYMPRENGSLGFLLDAGINADCKPEHLVQFATLGTLFVKHILGIPDPCVGLVNIGEEEGKGNLLAQAAYPLLKASPDIRFVGNIEGRDILMDKADVMVCEGFTGNVVLKLAESVYDIVKRRNIRDDYFDTFNYESYGGVPVLGVEKPVIIGHGISGAEAFHNMILMAERMIDNDLPGLIREAFAPAVES
ncbi:MAG: phosphate acyltransferase PlsX [Chitinophagaceae bacterium]|nr:phosphate acyltransferase PlsX [Chitinophagaceae bacterium]